MHVYLNRLITKYGLDMIYVSDSGHGGPAVGANTHDLTEPVIHAWNGRVTAAASAR